MVGLGPIGAGCGATLVRAGFDVVGIDLDVARASAWTDRTGAPSTDTPDDVDWRRVDIALVAVRLADHLSGVFPALPVGTSAMVLTTLAVSAARGLGKVTGPRVLECPVSGGEWAAGAGSLTTFVHAPSGASGRESEVLDVIGSRRFDFGAYGEPALAKLANNTLGAYNALATAAMLRLAGEQGLDPGRLLDIVNVSSGHSWMSEHFHEFPQDLLFKDVSLLAGDVGELPRLDLADLATREGEILEARANVVRT